MKIAVIEWAADDAEAPTLYVGPEVRVVRQAALAMYDRIFDDELCHDVVSEAGRPHEMTLDELYDWHYLVHQACTEPWVTFYDYVIGDPQARPDDVMNQRLIGIAS